jgi:hypothetical protein
MARFQKSVKFGSKTWCKGSYTVAAERSPLSGVPAEDRLRNKTWPEGTKSLWLTANNCGGFDRDPNRSYSMSGQLYEPNSGR